MTKRADSLHDRYREIAALYKQHGTAAGVAGALGVSRQRAALLLSQADEAGFLTYERRVPITITKTAARSALRSAGSIVAAAAHLGISDAALRTRFPDLVDEQKRRAAKAFITPADVRRERAAYAAARRERARAQGICTSCFAVPAGDGRSTCQACSAKAVARRDRLQRTGK